MIDDLSQQLQSLKVDRGRVISEYVPFVCKSLLASSDVLRSIGGAISANRLEERSKVLEEFHQEGAVDLATRLDYDANASLKVETAAKEWEEANFSVIKVFVANPDMPVDQLLSLSL